MIDTDKALYWRFMSRGDRCSDKNEIIMAMYWYRKAYEVRSRG